MVIHVLFLRDVACRKLLKSANVSRSYSRNNTGTVFLDTVWITCHSATIVTTHNKAKMANDSAPLFCTASDVIHNNRVG